MTSLFHSSGPKGSSSSSGQASSTNNPFQALTHFYEQELTDLHIDSTQSRQYRQQQQQQQQQQHNQTHRGKRSSPSSAFSFPPSAPFRSNSSSTSIPSIHDSKDKKHADEFNIFAQGVTHSTLANNFNIIPSSNADISEHLRQRQEYYLREARLRSADRNDGLGPIVDFSQLWQQQQHQHYGHHQHAVHHLLSRHHNPYAEEALHQRRQHKGRHYGESRSQPHHTTWVASTQQEQVEMDMSQEMEHAWHETMSDISSSSSSSSSSPALASANASKTLYPRRQQSSTIEEGSLASTFLNAAASLHSSWPLAPWAIETEAALMEFETLYKDYSQQQPQLLRRQLMHEHPQVSLHESHSAWPDEFSRAIMKETDTVPLSTALSSTRSVTDRRGSVKTCGFMLDPKRVHSSDEFEPLEISVVEAKADSMVSSAAGSASRQSLGSDEAWTAALRYEMQQDGSFDPTQTQQNHSKSSPKPLPHHQYEQHEEKTMVSIERPGLAFNDDVFEGDMLQAWMDTLAQEKQEADEQANESTEAVKEVEMSEADRLVLETAVRRLNALKHQLDGRSPSSPPPPLPLSPRMGHTA
ncbi:hypothetical protein BGZ83_010292 [Gryganskiella cystojenkinii]|nr:hypothetical protein BGZ83_010292 [Gryganskiella cystojenkinii]